MTEEVKAVVHPTFWNVVAYLSNGSLKDFAVNWEENGLGFNLKQIAGLYKEEKRRSEYAAEIRFRFSVLVVLLALGGFFATGLLNHDFGLKVSLIYLMTGFGIFLSTMFVRDTQFKRGQGPAYEAELKRFASALEKTCVALRTDLDGLINGGRSGASDDARRLLDKAASDLLILENARDNAPSPEERQRYGAQAREQRDRLDELFDLFQSLKLEKRSLGGIIEQKKKELEPTMVA